MDFILIILEEISVELLSTLIYTGILIMIKITREIPQNFIQDLPLYMSPIWLKRLPHSNWQYLLVSINDKPDSAKAVVVINPGKNRLKFKTSSKVTMAKLNGPVFFNLSQTTGKRYSQIKSLQKLIFEHVAGYDYFELSCFSHEWELGSTLAQSPEKKHYTTELAQNYSLSCDRSEDELLKSIQSKCRNIILKRDPSLEIKQSENFESLVELMRSNFLEKDISYGISDEDITILCSGLVEDGAGVMLEASKEGESVGAIFMGFDQKRAYYLFSGTNPAHKSLNSNTHLVWEALKLCSKRVKVFDFEGSSIPGVEKFIWSFNPQSELFYNMYYRSGKKRFLDFFR